MAVGKARKDATSAQPLSGPEVVQRRAARSVELEEALS
jgi:hypothetical protein